MYPQFITGYHEILFNEFDPKCAYSWQIVTEPQGTTISCIIWTWWWKWPKVLSGLSDPGVSDFWSPIQGIRLLTTQCVVLGVCLSTRNMWQYYPSHGIPESLLGTLFHPNISGLLRVGSASDLTRLQDLWRQPVWVGPRSGRWNAFHQRFMSPIIDSKNAYHTLIKKIMIQSDHNFAHVTTAKLSWHMQICDLTRALKSKLEQRECS